MPKNIQTQIKEEIEEFNRRIKENPNECELYVGRAYSYMLIGEYKKALSDCKICLKLRPKDKNVLMVAELLIKEIKKRL